MTGPELQKSMNKLNLKQKDIAEKLGITQEGVSSYYKRTNVSSETLEKICRAFNLKMNDLYQGTDLYVITNPIIANNNADSKLVEELKNKVNVLEGIIDHQDKIIKDISLEKEDRKLQNVG